MKKQLKIKITRFVTLFMIGMMGLMIINKALFLHVHKLKDGTFVEHAHPYNTSKDTSPIKTHHHTNVALLYFHNLRILFVLFLAALLIFTFKGIRIYDVATGKTSPLFFIHFNGRAPPSITSVAP